MEDSESEAYLNLFRMVSDQFLAQRGMEARTHLGGKLYGPGITQDLDGFLRLVHDHGAVFTVLEMAFQFGLQTGI